VASSGLREIDPLRETQKDVLHDSRQRNIPHLNHEICFLIWQKACIRHPNFSTACWRIR
jgi:hypothetical protein